jgi:hypothetical protein
MVQWMYLQRNRGIKFSSEGNPEPCVMSDASNKPDPADGLCHHGFVAMMAGGPIGWGSKKLPHVGLSAFHNEYMALRHAASISMWMHNLMSECGIARLIRNPIKLFGDNQAANELTAKDFISTGNQYIYQPYHGIKELVKGNYISTHFVGTKDNLADLFTKPVPYQAIDTLLNKLCGYDHTWETFPNTNMQWSSSTTVQWSRPQTIASAAKAVARKFHSALMARLRPNTGFNLHF